MNELKSYDLIILGAGPAGLTSGLYGSRAGLKTIVLDPKNPGGQMLLTDDIYNYPGHPDGITGQALADLFVTQALKYGCEVKNKSGSVSLEIGTEQFIVTAREAAYESEAVIVATGCAPRRLGAKGEKKFSGAGVSYCAVCDGNFFEDLDVAVVGGGDSAIEEAAYLSRLCKKVYIVHRRDRFRASEACQCLIRDRSNISVVWDSVVEEFQGDELLESLRLAKVNGSEKWDLKVSGAFIYVGQIPNTAFLPDPIAKDSAGWIITNEKLETSVPGIFAAGDVRKKDVRQVSTAVGDGSTAAISAEKYLMMKRCTVYPGDLATEEQSVVEHVK
jgi:thioredoxin reductase (NADPH)